MFIFVILLIIFVICPYWKTNVFLLPNSEMFGQFMQILVFLTVEYFHKFVQIDKDISSFSIYKVFRTVFFSLGFVRVCMTIWSQIVLIHLSTWQRKHIHDSAHSPLPLAHTHNKRRKFRAQRIHKIKLSVEIHFSNIRCVINNHCSFFIDGLVLKTK